MLGEMSSPMYPQPHLKLGREEIDTVFLIVRDIGFCNNVATCFLWLWHMHLAGGGAISDTVYIEEAPSPPNGPQGSYSASTQTERIILFSQKNNTGQGRNTTTAGEETSGTKLGESAP